MITSIDMKKEISKLSTALLILTLLSNAALAQTDYAVRINGDTLKGSLQILDFEQIDRVQIKTDKGKISLTALQVRCVKKKNELYRAVRYENTVRLMKVLIDGYLSLYAFHLSKQSSQWDGRYLTKLDGTGMEIPNLSFRKSLGNYLSDCGDIKEKLEKGELGKRDVEKIIGLYNTCMQNKTVAAIPKSTPATAPTPVVENEKALAVKNLVTKVEAENFTTKKDALDILKDIQSKVSKNESVPNYLLEGLKSSLAEVPSLAKDLDSVVTLLKN